MVKCHDIDCKIIYDFLYVCLHLFDINAIAMEIKATHLKMIKWAF